MKKRTVKELAKYLFSSGSSFFVDLCFFTLLNKIINPFVGLKSVLIATVGARIISSLYNYWMNSRVVFENWNRTSFYKYYALVIIQMCCSAMSVYILCSILPDMSAVKIKIPVDIILFIVNYLVQKKWIFIK